ncbi:MAG TPA: hypothetical protein PK772_02600 [Chitinophagaceae bacterium]|nr:hypothetical protein [Chitinophagaceae bacterium]
MRKIIFLFLLASITSFSLQAQVNAVQFGKNRVQYKKFKWQFFQAEHFNIYFAQHGLELAKYTAQVAEEELKNIEQAVEYSQQGKVNIIVYNHFDDMRTSNIGTDEGLQAADGLTKLVSNKMIVHFDGNHANLKRQVREGIAGVLVRTMLFGSNFSEVATNQAFLDLPAWLVDGYIAYAAEPWSTQKDNALKSAMLSGEYNSFYAFAMNDPLLAGQSFWYYIAEKYGKQNVSYLMYLSRIHKSLNNAVEKICKKKLKAVLQEFINDQQTKYYEDIRKRKSAPKGKLTVTEATDVNTNFFRFQANPNPKSFTYAVVKYESGLYKVILNENYVNIKTLLRSGVRMKQNEANPNYPILAWDPKGTRLLVIYTEKSEIKMFMYDVFKRYKYAEQTLSQFDQIVDAQFMFNENTLLLSAVKNGHTDIFTYKIDKQQIDQITNDVYDDVDPAFVAFSNKTGIIFSSNRPTATAGNADTAIPGRNRYNIFLSDISTKQITQLTQMKYGNARYPSQYNGQHFTFISDENGIGNRYAGFFTTQRTGLDTLITVGDEVLRNPSPRELDSALRIWNKPQPDATDYISMSKDSTYTFPLSNYQSSLLESRVAGERGQLSEVVQQGNYKFLYKLKLDTVTLRKRNVATRPTAYMKKIMQEDKLTQGKATLHNSTSTTIDTAKNIFQSPFENDTTPSRIEPMANKIPQYSILQDIKLYKYKLKFSVDQVSAGISNNVLLNRFQPYAYGYGPVFLNNYNGINFTFSASISDLFEDYKIFGGARFGLNFVNNEYLFGFQNNRKRLDWGLLFYRGTNSYLNVYPLESPFAELSQKVITSLYQVNLSYPLDRIRSIRANMGYRNDRSVVKPINRFNNQPDVNGLSKADTNIHYAVGHLEYVHDNTLNTAQNIWNGLRFKIYGDYNVNVTNISKTSSTYNIGFDARYYHKIYRNFIWAIRAAGDMSFGDRKIIYYLGGADGWINPKFNNDNPPNAKEDYIFQTLALNMRGFNQNVANGSRAIVVNSEFRLPMLSTFFNTPSRSPILSNLQFIQFFDIGTAWEGGFENIKRPTVNVTTPPINIFVKTGGIGPFVAGYGFGLRTSLLGYFVKADMGWPMNSFFKRNYVLHFGLGVDF